MNRKTNMFLIVFLAICLLISPNLGFADGTERVGASNIEPYALLPMQKTVREIYTSLGGIPDYYSYREYDDVNDGWWAGFLPLVDIEVLSGGRYRGIFKGTIIFSY